MLCSNGEWDTILSDESYTINKINLVNSHISFFKIMKEWWNGRIVDNLRNLYTKSHFREKRSGKLSTPIASTLGVNQGGVAFFSIVP